MGKEPEIKIFTLTWDDTGKANYITNIELEMVLTILQSVMAQEYRVQIKQEAIEEYKKSLKDAPKL